MNFNFEEFQNFRDDFQQALLAVAEKYALTIEAGSISFKKDTFSFKVICVKTDTGDIKQKEFERYCAVYDFSKDDYNREFISNGEKYALTELAVKSPKYPCIATNIVNKNQYKFTANYVKQAFGK